MNYISNMFSEMNCNEFIIKKYLKDDHYQKWHCERSNLKTSDRAFAWMIYLNTVNNGGETDFYYYNKSIKPKEGLTLFGLQIGHISIEETQLSIPNISLVDFQNTLIIKNKKGS